MKIKSNQTRIYDGDGYKKRAACLCFRNESEEEVNPGLGVERAIWSTGCLLSGGVAISNVENRLHVS